MTYRTHDQVASEFIAEGKRRNITERGIIICIATGLVESNLTVYANAKVAGSIALPHDAVGSDGYSVGPLQQQVVMGNGWWWGPVEVCQDPTGSAGLFYDRLAKKNYDAATTDSAAGAIAQSIQGSAFPDRYQQRMPDARSIYARLSTGASPPVTDPNRPDFNEYGVYSNNSQSRNGTKVDLWLLHTNEGDSNADQLAHWMQGNVGVSYHYTVSQAPDGGVTVCDVVDTDQASWSVLSANNRSINLCFAGSKVAWTRDQWLKQSKAIDVAAYLAVQDCRKYGIPTTVNPPPYKKQTGISDHAYVTQVLKDGTHTDVGPNFPWDVFTAAVTKYSSGAVTPPVVTPPPPAAKTDHQLLQEIWDQLRISWPQLGNRTLVDAVAELLKDKP